VVSLRHPSFSLKVYTVVSSCRVRRSELTRTRTRYPIELWLCCRMAHVGFHQRRQSGAGLKGDCSERRFAHGRIIVCSHIVHVQEYCVNVIKIMGLKSPALTITGACAHFLLLTNPPGRLGSDSSELARRPQILLYHIDSLLSTQSSVFL
jgi:hypothetical protein